MINIKTYSISNIPLTTEILDKYINSFWTEIFEEIKEENYLLLMCKVKFTDIDQENHKTLGHLVQANFEDKDLFIDYLSQRLSILNDSYVTIPICQITFSYVIKSGKCKDENRSLLMQDITDKSLQFHNFNNMNLPVTMNPLNYGILEVSKIIEENGKVFERFIVTNNNKTFRIDVFEGGKINKVTILGTINLSWIDTKISEEIFYREIKKSTIYFMDGEIVLRKKELSAKPFKKLSKNNLLINDFYTMDIETINVNNNEVPYLINAYDGRHHLNVFNKNPEELFNIFIETLLSKIDSKTIVYAHNLSGFDGILILNHLFRHGKVEPLLFNGRLISIKLKVFGIKGSKTIVFKDSYLLLPLGLRKLCDSFNIVNPKSYFPFNLTNIFYSGVFPEYECWTDIGFFKWVELKTRHGNTMWSFKLESIKYCERDCESLHQVLTKFTELIYAKFSIDAHKSLTLPALAMRIYKTHFMPENTIYQLVGLPEFNIRQSYSGGAVDVYIPSNKIIESIDSITSNKIKSSYKKLYTYDVNSLFPFIMANYIMPIGKPIAFLGDIE